MRPVRFSEVYDIGRTSEDDWFDPILSQDTELYVDPFLIFLEQHPDWANGHAQLMAFFNAVMKLLAQSGFDDRSPAFRKAKDLLMFPEPPEFCLGTSKGSIFGAGSAKGLQEGMLRGAAEVIRLGIEELRHFEELALFGKQIGRDRIGDITCDVLKPEFVEYTQKVAERHGVQLHEVNVGRNGWDAEHLIWKPGLVRLPLNPVATELMGRPIGVILTPKRFLRQMPTVDQLEFWDFAWTVEGDQLKSDFNYTIGRNVDAEEIVRLARRKRHLLVAYLSKLENTPKFPYDVDEDPQLIVRRPDFGKEIADALTVPPPSTEEEFSSFVDRLIENFKQCVEHRGAWKLLWTEGKPRREHHVQLLFQTSAVWACQDRDVDMSPESNAGRGPVDFKMSRGWKLRALLEMKLAKSSSFKKNLKNQTPVYAKAEGCDRGYFIVVQFTEDDMDPEFVRMAQEMAAQVAAREKIAFSVVFVDARPKESASKVS